MTILDLFLVLLWQQALVRVDCYLFLSLYLRCIRRHHRHRHRGWRPTYQPHKTKNKSKDKPLGPLGKVPLRHIRKPKRKVETSSLQRLVALVVGNKVV